MTALPEARDYIDGEFVATETRPDAHVCDANTGEVLAAQATSRVETVRRALEVAALAEKGEWPRMSPTDRGELLRRVGSEIEARAAQMAECDARLTGVLLAFTQKFSHLAAATMRVAADVAIAASDDERKEGQFGEVVLRRFPRGAAVIIAPWNAPGAIGAHKLSSALAAGCPTVMKASEFTPASANLIAEAVHAAGLPRGVFQLVHGAGDVGHLLVSDARTRVVSFTGGPLGGRAVAEACARNMTPVQLELGGNNAFVVLKGADIEKAAEGLVQGLTTMNGQWCRAIGRVVAHRDVIGALREATLARFKTLKLGSSMDADSQMGPMAHEVHMRHVRAGLDRLRRAGGTLHHSTDMPRLKGWFVPPTLVSGVSMADAQEEIFGPVATMHAFETTEQAIDLANDSPFGLAGYVFGDEQEALEVAPQLRTGGIKVNGVSVMSLHHDLPRPAWGISGMGDEGSVATFEHFRGSRVFGVAGR